MRRARPAAAPAVLRRPAARVRGRVETEDQVTDKYKKGNLVECHKVKLGSFAEKEWIEATEATYYKSKAPLAGRVQSEELSAGERRLIITLTGTESEDVLRQATGDGKVFKLHLCGPDCDQRQDGPTLCHAKKIQKVKEETATWQTNLEEEEETSGLHKDCERWEEKDKKKKDKKEVKSSSSEKKKKKKKKKEKEKKGEEESPEKTTTKKGPKEASKKRLESFFSGTGLDPNPKKRRKLEKRAKKALKKGKVVSTSSGSFSTSSSEEEPPLCDDNRGLDAPSVAHEQWPLRGGRWESPGCDGPVQQLVHHAQNRGSHAAGMSDLVLRHRPAAEWQGSFGFGRPHSTSEVLGATGQWKRLAGVPETRSGTLFGAILIGSRAEVQVAHRDLKMDRDTKPPNANYQEKRKGKGQGKQKGKEKNKGKNKQADGKKEAAS